MSSQTFVTITNSLQAAGWLLTSTSSYNNGYTDITTTEFAGTATVETDGSGLWDAPSGIKVNITKITVIEYRWLDDGATNYEVNITHDCTEDGFMLYTDGLIEQSVSKLLGINVWFTEQGMQDEFNMSMET